MDDAPAVRTLAEVIEALIHNLSLPDAYPQEIAAGIAAADIRVIQTHISVIFLIGDRAFKVKKPVDLGFLDFTSLDSRRHFCAEEVRLNRRLAPDIYLGIAEIARDGDGLRVSDAFEPSSEREETSGGEVIDYAVVMRRMPQDAMMDRRLARGEIDNEILDRLADLVVSFHAACPTGEGVDEHATPDELRRQVRDNLEGLSLPSPSGRSGALARDTLDFLRDHLLTFIDGHQPLLRSRIADGRIREGHGDLHSRNICILDEHNRPANEIVIYDCIEFSRAFRCRDVACEIAFLAMDLDFNGFRAFAAHFVREYAERADDPEIHDLIDFYKMHFAIVRAKVETVRSREEEVGEEDRCKARDTARRYLHLAAGYALRPCMILMCGLPATGKSHIASALEAPLSARTLRSDVIRKELAGMSPTDHDRSGDESGIYSREMTQRTYEEMLARAQAELEHGWSVIADATFPAAPFREPFMRLAAEKHIRALLIETTALEDVIRQRMAARASDQTDASDADWSVYLRARGRFEPPNEIDPDRRLRIDTEETDENDAIAMAMNALVSVND